MTEVHYRTQIEALKKNWKRMVEIRCDKVDWKRMVEIRCDRVDCSGNCQRLSTLRFMPLGHEVSRALVHLLSLILLRTGSSLHRVSITNTPISSTECPEVVRKVLSHWFHMCSSMCDVYSMVIHSAV